MGKVIEIRRHGDVLVKTHNGFKVPRLLKMVPMKTLHVGLNHEHTIRFGSAKVGEKNGIKYMRVSKDLTVDHEEHGKGVIPKGDYWVEIKSEYSHFDEESRQVVD